jgi:hypothetical protein
MLGFHTFVGFLAAPERPMLYPVADAVLAWHIRDRGMRGFRRFRDFF